MMEMWYYKDTHNNEGVLRMSAIGQRIRKLRIEKGLTQEELGNMLGVKKSAVQKYESGVITNLKADTMRRVCEIFNAPSYLFLWEHIEDFDAETLALIRARPNVLRKAINMEFGAQIVDMIDICKQINQTAQSKIIEYATDLSKIEEYRVQDGSS